MYHSAYSTPWLLGNNIQHRLPLYFTYGDLPVITVNHLTSILPYQHLSQVYPMQVSFDVPSMKRIPISLLMQSVESVNCYVPTCRRKNLSWSTPERRFSKDGSVEHGSRCTSSSSDSCASNSRASTPSSVGTLASEGQSVASGNSGQLPMKRQRKLSDSRNQYGRSPQQKYSPLNQRHSPTSVKDLNFGYQKNNSHYNIPMEKEWDKVSLDIWRHYVKNRQPEEMFFKKMKLKDDVHRVLHQIFPNCGLFVVGSSVNGLGTNTSDMDVCLVLSPMEIDQQTEAMQLLRLAQRLLSKCSFVKSTELITAKVPILKFTDKYASVHVDLNINNTVGISNTNLITNYIRMDWRVQPLVLAIKKWAQDSNINNAKDMTLSSYSLVLMIIHYLQCGCDPCVLPCLQKMRQKRIWPDKWVDFQSVLPHFKSKNTESLGQLLFGFFDYFSNTFNFEKDAISVRLGCKLPKHIAMNYRSIKNKKGHWKYVCIEEPFNHTNTACAVYDAESFGRILLAFKNAYLKLKMDQKILSPIRL